MEYTIWELIIFFFTYAILGWCLNICIEALCTGKLKNTGLLHGPISLYHGISMLLITVFLRNFGGNMLVQFWACVTVTNAVEFLVTRFSNRMTKVNIFDFVGHRAVLENWSGLLYGLFIGLCAMFAVNLLNPFIYIFCQVIPLMLLKGIAIGLCILFACDVITTLYVLNRIKKEWKLARDVSSGLGEASMNMGYRIYSTLRKHIYHTYPELQDQLQVVEGFGIPVKKKFAEGLSLHKLLWVFLICALLGDWIETVYVWAVSGVFMSRSSLIYGTFSVVWGFGAVLLTLILQPVAKKDDRYIFIGGFFLGGTYEYMCSVFTELVFGMVFWDYSKMPLNINGRTNVWYMIAWGVLSVVWIKILYPRISNWIEKIPPILGTVTTWILIVFMILDITVSGMAMLRYTQRQEGSVEKGAIGTFIDVNYPDELIEFIWPNMKMTEQ